ncbi:MAG: type I-E CRISPR-associated protein Cse1/CasA [Caldilinea sp. CFX5]|nr:type I-E CRISPR-associated protein Cse1/CasA [Caldilinea sp. CFX5]
MKGESFMDQPVATTTFNLWSTPWITLERMDGSTEEVSIEQALLRAPEFAAIFDTSPLVVVGIHRLLTAIVQFMLDPQYEDEIADRWRAGHFPPDKIKEFGQHYSHRFDLFSAAEPFMQSADIPLLPTKALKTKLKSIAYLANELPAGTAVSHYRHGRDEQKTFCAGCAAKGLITLPAFASSGGAGIKPSINGVPPIYIFPSGDSLFTMLVASLLTPAYQPEIRDQRDDKPAWLREPVIPQGQELLSVGYLQSLTFTARRVRLFPQSGPFTCARCGRNHLLGVSSMIFEMGESRLKEAAFWFDPFAAYRLPTGKSSKPKPPTPIRPIEGRVLWREFAGLFLQSKDTGRRPAVLQQLALLAIDHNIGDPATPYPFRCVGLRTDMKAKIFEWIDAEYGIAPQLLADAEGALAVQEAIDFAVTSEGIIKQVFRQHFAGPSHEHERHSRLKAEMTQSYWHTLAEPFRQFVLEITPNTDRNQVVNRWLDTVITKAKGVFQETTQAIGDDGTTLCQRVQAEAACVRLLYHAKAKQTGG